mmetsp:Transcript_87057/g.177869  ORF Transcript_87057/g.177869 Transcript_87057/m.177869 type:complete len:989 (-) Transcript_87057:358-3324(-)
MVMRPSSALQRPRTARQRAIYSEVLLVEGKPGTQKLAGPPQSREFRSTREPRPLSAHGFAQRKRHVPALMESIPLTKYAVIEPKVIESHKTVSGRCPRRLRIERLKKRYESQDIQKLLIERGLDVTLPWYEDISPLPLSVFDNRDYDLRSPFEWLALAKDPETGEERPLPALALWRDPADGTGYWRRAVVLQYDSAGEKFEVQYEEAEPTELGGRRGMMEFLPRLRVMFRGEDPEAFANRVEEAYKSRSTADFLLRYNFYIDNMPTDDVQQLNGDQLQWLRKAVGNKRAGVTAGGAELEFVLQEVQLDFARAMNRVTFDTHVLQGNADPLQESLLPYVEKGFVAQALSKPLAPWKGRISIPRHRFSETFAKFCFATLRIRPEVVLALQGIKAQSEARLLENIFGIDVSRPLRLDEFRQNLRSSCAEASMALKEDWLTSLQTIVLREFDGVKKGWFNVREKNVDLYRHGKLRRFLVLARLVMQDTLRNLAKISVERYVSTMERLAPVKTMVESLSDAECVFRDSIENPVLAVEVRPADDLTHFDFVLHPDRFVSTALDAYNVGLQSLNEVYPLERLMIPARLQSPEAPSLIETFQFDEVWVQDGSQRIQSCLESACAGPVDFLKKLQILEPLLRRDPAAMVEAFFKDEPANQEIQEAISKEIKMQQELWWQLLEVVNVGMFQVTTKDVRKTLAAKHEVTQALLMERLVRRLRIQMDETTSDFRSLVAKITKAPKNVVELVKMRHSMDELPNAISEMQCRIQQHVRLYEEIEGFCHQLSPEDFRMRWDLVAGPYRARHLLAQKAVALQEHEAEFVRELLREQDELQERLQEIEETLHLFRSQPAYWDISSLSMAREASESLLERIEQAQEDSKSINQTEITLERKATDYSQIHRYSMDFNPFYQVWAIVYAFHEDQTKFRLGAIADKDALRRKLIQTYQVLEKTVKILQTSTWPAPIVQLGENQLLQMEEFQLLLLSESSRQPDDSDADG